MCVRKKMRELNECEKKGGNRMCVGCGKKEGDNRTCVRKKRRELKVWEKRGRQLKVCEKKEEGTECV